MGAGGRQQTDPAFVLNFFQEELNSDNVHHRLFAANNVALVAAAMGPEHARGELMQYLLNANQLDGEVQMYLAIHFATLVKYVGGAEHAHVLLGPLKVLAAAEESIVRDKAIESLGVVCDAIPAAAADASLMATCKDLAAGEFFTSRSSACAFIVRAYARVSDGSKATLRQTFKALAKDETPMVRRAALKFLPKLCEQLPAAIIMGELAKDVLMNTVSDDEDSVRLLLPQTLAVVSPKLSDADRTGLILPLVKSIVKDGSWRVRSSLATELPAIAAPFPADVIAGDVFQVFSRLLRDPEAETETSACHSISGMLPLLTVDGFIADKLLPEVDTLTKDGSPQVRREVSLRLMELAIAVGKAQAQNLVVPLVVRILHEGDHEASVALLNSLIDSHDKIDLPAITPAVLPVILEVAYDTHWRVKVVIIKLIPIFAKVLGLDEFTKKLFPLAQTWLGDQIFSVRDTMAKQGPGLIQLFGADWAVSALVPVVLHFRAHQSYLVREMTLLSLGYLAESLPIQVLTKHFLPAVLAMAADKVANVRVMVAKSLLVFVSCQDAKLVQQIQACLKTLSADADQDVKYFASLTKMKYH